MHVQDHSDTETHMYTSTLYSCTLLPHTHTHIHAHTLTHARAHTHTHDTHAHTLTHAHTHTHTNRFITETAEVRSVFLKITDLFDGKADTIENALLQFCDRKEISVRKVMEQLS